MEIELVTSNDSIEFTQLVHALTHSSVVAFDAEWKPHRQPTTFPNVSLLQIACLGPDDVESPVFLVDLEFLKLELNSVYELLSQVFVAPDVIKLGFSFRQDLVYLSSTFRQQGFDAAFQTVEPYIDINAIYDYLLPKLLGREISKKTKGLATICEEILGITLSKEQQCSDWSLRPLTEEQKIYAALDALCLLRIFNVFKEKFVQEVNDLRNQNKDCPCTSDIGVSNGDALLWIVMKLGDKISLKNSDKMPMSRAAKMKGKKFGRRLQSKAKTLKIVQAGKVLLLHGIRLWVAMDAPSFCVISCSKD